MDALRFFLAEELRRSGVTLERYPPADSRVRAARDLHNATRWLLETDRLREAIESLRDLRTIVHSLDTTHEGTAPFTSGPDEPTIEELYARVLERANVLSARLHMDLEGAMEAPATPHDEGRPDPESYVTSEPNALLAREVPSSRSRSSRPRP